MALIIKVGVSRKVTADYQSRGYTLDVQSEFDPRTLDDTNTLAAATDNLFQLANQLLEQQVQKATEDTPANRTNGHATGQKSRQTNGARNRSVNGNSNGQSNGNGNHNGNNHNENRGQRSITEAQVRAVTNMAKRLRVDPDAYAGDNYERSLRELTIREGSELIDLMKSEIESQQAKGAFR